MKWLALLSVVFVSACTSPHKTYQPPSNVKVTASTKKAHESARAAKAHVDAAQKHADAISVRSLDVQKKLDAIIKVAPPELQSALTAVKVDVTDMQTHEEGLHTELSGAQKRQDELENHQNDLERNQAAYYVEAQTLANAATNERESLITVQKQLIQQKIFGWLWKIGGVLIILVIGLLIFLWFTGKLAFKFVK